MEDSPPVERAPFIVGICLSPIRSHSCSASLGLVLAEYGKTSSGLSVDLC